MPSRSPVDSLRSSTECPPHDRPHRLPWRINDDKPRAHRCRSGTTASWRDGGRGPSRETTNRPARGSRQDLAGGCRGQRLTTSKTVGPFSPVPGRKYAVDAAPMHGGFARRSDLGAGRWSPSPTGGRPAFRWSAEKGWGLCVATTGDFHMATGRPHCSSRTFDESSHTMPNLRRAN